MGVDYTETRELKERVVEINRVAKVVKGGRRFSFTALVVVGDEVDRVGVGYGKAREVPLAITKAVEDAKKNMFTVPKHGSTITHEVLGRFDAARVMLRPASEGTGVIAGGGVRAVLELGGVRNVLAKSLGTTNPINMAKATVVALQQLRRPEDVARSAASRSARCCRCRRSRRLSSRRPRRLSPRPSSADAGRGGAGRGEARRPSRSAQRSRRPRRRPVAEEPAGRGGRRGAGGRRRARRRGAAERGGAERRRGQAPPLAQEEGRRRWRRCGSPRCEARSARASGIAARCARSGSARSAARRAGGEPACSKACCARSASREGGGGS